MRKDQRDRFLQLALREREEAFHLKLKYKEFVPDRSLPLFE